MNIAPYNPLLITFIALALVLGGCASAQNPPAASPAPSPSPTEGATATPAPPTPPPSPDMVRYLDILQSNLDFYLYNPTYLDIGEGEAINTRLDEYLRRGYYSDNSEDPTGFVYAFALIDMDGDGELELVTNAAIYYLVFHTEASGGVVAVQFDGDNFKDLKKDATFASSMSYSDDSKVLLDDCIQTLRFTDGGFQAVDLAYRKWVMNDGQEYNGSGSDYCEYYYDGDFISEDDFGAVRRWQWGKADVEWYHYDEDSIEEDFAAAWSDAFP
ncbi:MAG: hypothetical protein LBI54_04480 [Lachnospiraceae bacterium]|nr:hypothetical protein [Lachnospiraceae bacterium]